MESDKEYTYKNCPNCGKKLFRVIDTSDYKHIYIWCKNCKKEIEFNNRASEPKR